ncbi:hypothetical protein ACP70R_000405 [Stipagrostis hirtigluma subsp. patula]
MGSSTRRLLLVALAVSLVVLAFSARPAAAARPAPEAPMLGDSEQGARHGATELEKITRETVELLLLAKLPAGPSPKGPGH